MDRKNLGRAMSFSGVRRLKCVRQPPVCSPVFARQVKMSTMKTSQSAFSKEELISCGYGKLFGIGNPQLPIGDMLMVDRVTHISSEGAITTRAK